MEHNRMKGLDGLRAIAIIGVILFHLYPYDVVGGYVGVCLFFVLSGFLVGYRSFLDMSNMNFSMFRFYGKRLLRIYPGLFFMVFASCGGFYLVSPEILGGKRPEILSIFLGYNNWWQLLRDSSYFARIAGQTPFLHIWSLAIELQFYLVYPLFFYLFLWLVKKIRKQGALWILVMGSLLMAVYMANRYMAGADVGRLYYGTDTRMFSFLLGVCGGYFKISTRQDTELPFRWIYNVCYVIALGLLVVAYGWMNGEASWTYIGGLQLMSLLFLVMILMTADERLAIGRVMDIAPLRWLGSRSYEIYLWHYPIVFYLHYRKWMQRPECVAAGIVLSLALAEWTHWGTRIFIKHQFPKLFGKIVFFLCSVVMILTMGVGIVGVARAPRHELSDVELLRQELEESRRAVEKQKKQQEVPTEATEEATAEEQPASGYIDGESVVDLNSVTIIGDSVLLSASEELMELMPNARIDAKESRQLTDAIEIINQMKAEGTLGTTVVIALGTNGYFREDTGQALINAIGSDRNIYWV
ncbi:MAG: acyltransferase, partial [Lachnospiraceae bacterium]|nr:acyltransferase [Lachnospiraceae bacterium]